MAYTIDSDILQSNAFAYAYDEGELVTVAPAVLVSSTGFYGIYSAFAGSQLSNNGYVVALHAGPDGIAVLFTEDDSSVLNAAGASITGFFNGVFLGGARSGVVNDGSIQGLTDAGVIFFDAAGQSGVANRGSVSGYHGIEYRDTTGTHVINNSGHIRGGGLYGNGVLIDGSNSDVTGTVKIVNQAGGVISGQQCSIGTLEADSVSVVIDNRGRLDGDIFLTDGTHGNDVIVNRGILNGDTLLGAGNDTFRNVGGRSGAVFGYAGNDTLVGGRFADQLAGDDGNDRLTGGAGKDAFHFRAALDAAKNVDVITDFQPDIDTIVLQGDVFAGVNAGGPVAAARFHVGAAAADASDRIIYNSNTGALFFDHDGRGGDPQVRFAQLAPHLALDHADFLILVA